MLISPPIDQNELDLLNFLHLSLSPVLLRGISLLIHVLTAFLFGKLVAGKKRFSFLGFFIFLFSPWTSYLSTFFHFQNLVLLATVLIVYTKKVSLVVILSLASIVFLNKFYPQYSLSHQLNPKNLDIGLTQRQNIDFLSVERKFLLPYPIRLFIYNKPFYSTNVILSQFVSYFDFEQTVSPMDSYEIIKLSGLSPKGNLSVLYIWEIPLVIFGIYLLTKKKFEVNGKNIFLLFILGIIPYLFFEKKLLPETAFLTAVPILIIETYALDWFFEKKYKILKILLLIIATLGVFNFYKTLIFKTLSYQTPQSYLYMEVARWISKNYQADKQFIITTRFGPTDKMIPYYLGIKQNNIIYENIDLKKEELKPNTYYIGLIGEFVGKGKGLEKKDPPGGIEIVSKIKGEDEPVFEYGENIWIGYSK